MLFCFQNLHLLFFCLFLLGCLPRLICFVALSSSRFLFFRSHNHLQPQPSFSSFVEKTLFPFRSVSLLVHSSRPSPILLLLLLCFSMSRIRTKEKVPYPYFIGWFGMLELAFWLSAINYFYRRLQVLKNAGFHFPVLLSFIHYVVTLALIAILNALSLIPPAPPLKSTPLFTLGLVMSLCTGLANVSLKYNRWEGVYIQYSYEWIFFCFARIIAFLFYSQRWILSDG